MSVCACDRCVWGDNVYVFVHVSVHVIGVCEYMGQCVCE